MYQVWWDKVPSALSFINEIIDSLIQEKSVIIQYSSVLPWRSEFVDIIKEHLRVENSSKTFRVLDDVEDPGAYLLQEFCKPEKRASYRPSKTYGKFFADSNDIVLHTHYLWIRIESRESMDRWTTLVSDYLKARNKTDEAAVFIFEWSCPEPTAQKKGIKIYSFEDYINEYDRIVFATLASSSVKENPFIKNYLTELAANVVGNNIELCALCISRYKEFLNTPYEIICDIVDNNTDQEGNEFINNMTIEDVNHCVWQAQIRTVYPKLEEFREEFVQKHASAIKEQLPIKTAYDEECDDPKDVELGTLIYMAGTGGLYLSYHEYEELNRYKEARNKLSHLDVLSLDEIRAL